MKLENITKIFYEGRQNEIKALNNINLEIIDRGLVIITGQSGSGKTTLINILSGLELPDKGIIYPEAQFRRGSFVFQDYQLFNDQTVFENLNIIQQIKKEKENKKITKVLDELGMTPFLNSSIKELSGGQKQRVAIARALLLDYGIVYCDEPTASLDSKHKSEIANLLKKVSDSRLVIVVSHEEKLWDNLYDQKITLKDGCIRDSVIRNPVFESYEQLSSTLYSIPNKVAFSFTKKSFLKNKIKNITAFFLMFISFMTMLLAMSISMNSNAVSTVKSFENAEIPFISFMEVLNTVDGEHNLVSISKSNAVLFNKKNQVGIFYHYEDGLGYEIDNYQFDDELKVKQILLSEKVEQEILRDNEIVISYVMARFIAISLGIQNLDLIGKEFLINNHTLKIVNILSQNFQNEKYENPDFLKDQFFVIINSNTFENIKTKTHKDKFMTIIDDNNIEKYIVISKTSSDFAVDYGILPSMPNEIVISTRFVREFFNSNGDFIDVLGQSIELDFIRKTNRQNIYDETKKMIFTIVGIEDNASDRIYLMPNQYDQLLIDFDVENLENNSSRGVYSFSYNASLIKKLLEEGLYHNTYISVEVEKTIVASKTISFIMYIVSFVFSLITILLFLNITSINLITRKNEIGILRSMYISINSIMKILIFDFMTLVFIALFTSILSYPILLNLFNKFLISQSIAHTMWINVNYFTFLTIVLFTLIFASVVVFIQRRKLNSFSIVDTIYDR